MPVRGAVNSTLPRSESPNDDLNGVGLGFVSVFDPDGHPISHRIAQGKLNAPWGLAANFGKFSNRLFVVNCGDGLIGRSQPADRCRPCGLRARERQDHCRRGFAIFRIVARV